MEILMLLEGILNQTITTIASTTRDGYGRITATTLYSDVPCRWQEKFTMTLDKFGNEAVSKAQAWLKDKLYDEDILIDIDYICTYNSKEYTVLAYEFHYDLSGEVEYIKLYMR
jgi:hypothetical protein